MTRNIGIKIIRKTVIVFAIVILEVLFYNGFNEKAIYKKFKISISSFTICLIYFIILSGDGGQDEN
jgi:hypothetical protein